MQLIVTDTDEAIEKRENEFSSAAIGDRLQLIIIMHEMAHNFILGQAILN